MKSVGQFCGVESQNAPKGRRSSTQLINARAFRVAVIAALLSIAAIPQANAIILIVVLTQLDLFEVEGLTFTSYATSQQPVQLRITDTADGFTGSVELRGQAQRSGDLNLLAVSVADPRQQIRLEMDTRPLPGPPREGITTLESRPMPIEPPRVIDRALLPFADPLGFAFRFIDQRTDPETGGILSDYRLEQIGPVPEPSSALLAALGFCLRSRLAHSRRGRASGAGRAAELKDAAAPNSVPNFRTSRLLLAQVVCHAHRSSASRTECPDARTSPRTRAQIVWTPAQTLRIVAQSQG
jgi:hypothetical protein